MTQSASAFHLRLLMHTPGKGRANDVECFCIQPGGGEQMTEECFCIHWGGGEQMTESASAYTGEGA